MSSIFGDIDVKGQGDQKSDSGGTIHGALHPAAGHPANNFTVSDIQPLAEGDLEWAGCVTVCGRLGREL